MTVDFNLFFSLLHPSPKLKTIGLILLHLGFSLLLVTVSYYRSSKVILACIIFLATWLHLTSFSLSVRFRGISNSEIHRRFLALLQFCVFLYWVLIGSLCIPSFWIYIYILIYTKPRPNQTKRNFRGRVLSNYGCHLWFLLQRKTGNKSEVVRGGWVMVKRNKRGEAKVFSPHGPLYQTWPVK